MELKHYFVILQRWGWILLLITLVAAVAGYLFILIQPPVYEAQARYLVGPVLENPNVQSDDLRTSSRALRTYAELATSRPVVQSMLHKLNLDADVDDMIENEDVTATWIDAPLILDLHVRAATPELAADMANALGEVLIERSPSSPSSLYTARRQEAVEKIAQLQERVSTTETEIDWLVGQIRATTNPATQSALMVRLEQLRAQLANAQQALSDEQLIIEHSPANQLTLVQPPVIDPEPAEPNIVITMLAALFGGLVVGTVTVLLLEYSTNVVYTPEELQEATGLAYLGGITRHKKLQATDGSQLVVQACPETPAAESYRILRAKLHSLSREQHLKSLLITSPSVGDGRSEIAANLAISLAKAGQQIILIDADLRRPGLSKLFGLPDDVGVSNLLEQPDQVLDPTPIESIPGLAVLPAGPPSPEAPEILGSQYMLRLIEQLEARADMVILDSPPLLVSDALVLAPMVDGVLLVASHSRTGRETITKAAESLRLIGGHVVGTVLNRVKVSRAHSYSPAYATRNPAQLPTMPANSSTYKEATGAKAEADIVDVMQADH